MDNNRYTILSSNIFIKRSHTPCGKEQGVLEMGGMQSPKQFYVMNGVTPSCVRPPHTATQRKIIMNP
jgi:hypothetical protein